MSGFMPQDFHTGQITVPTELSFSDEYKTLSDYRIKTIKVSPQNGTSFGLGDEIMLQVPAMDRTFMDPRNSFMRARLSIPTDGHHTAFQFKGGYTSLIDQQEVYVNNTSVRASYVQRYNELFALLKNWSVSQGRQYAEALLLGTASNYTQNATWGLKFQQPDTGGATSNDDQIFRFDIYIPLMGEFGTGSFIPIFNSSHMIINRIISDINLLAAKSPTRIDGTANGAGSLGQTGVPDLTVDQVEFHASVLTLNIPDFQQLMSMYIDQSTGLGTLPIKTVSYDLFTSNLMTTGTSSVSINIPSTVRSARRFFIKFYPADASLSDYPLGGINANCSSLYLRVNGNSYPHQPIDTMSNPLSAYLTSLQSFANLLVDGAVQAGFRKETYLRTDALPSDKNTAAWQMYTTKATDVGDSNCWSLVLDAEQLGAPRAPGTLMGTPLNNSASLEVVCSPPLSQNIIAEVWVEYDSVLVYSATSPDFQRVY